MQTLRVETVTEKPGIVTVQAIKPDSVMTRENQMVGFFVRARREGDRFQIARWEEFSPRWMRFVDQPPEDWAEKIRARESAFGRDFNVELAGIVERKVVETPDDAIALSRAGKSEESGSINYASGKITKTLSLKK